MSSRPFRRVLFPLPGLLLLGALLATACGGDDSIERVYEGELRVTPEVLTFSSQEIGLESIQFLTMENVGQASLIVDGMTIESRSTEFAIVGAQLPIRLQPGEERVVEVWYTPADCQADRGSVVIQSNDRSHRDGFIVPLQPQEMGGQVRVDPNPIDFGRVPASTARTLPVTVVNTGTCALHVNDLFLTGSFDFQMTQPAGDGVMPFEPVLPFELEPAATYVFDITFSPTGDGFDEATLLVRSDDARDRTVEVPVYANGGQPCLVVTDEEGIDFGQRFFGERSPKTITITNCSQREDLQVTSISLGAHWEYGGFERFSLSDLPDLSSALVIPPQESAPFVLNYEPVRYTPETNPACTSTPCEVTDHAVLTIESNDEFKNPLDIEVSGVGTDNHCPVAVARARIEGSGDPWDTQIDSIPLLTVEFDGSGSTDPEGPIASYQWEVTTRPEGSNATFSPNSQMANPTFFLDLAGRFDFTLRVYDGLGVESCEPATIMALVTPGEDIHVQMVWETPADRTRDDYDGSDVDLHLLHPSGIWNNSPGDCFFANGNPDWGMSGGSDDPSLDIDDVNGWGPENINLNNPEGTVDNPYTYKVGVYYYSDHGYGPSDVTIRIYLDGIERFETTFSGLANHQFWDVARVTWPTREIERIHRLYPTGYP